MAAAKIQAAARGFLTRCWYRRLYATQVGAAIRVQSMMRMKWARRRFLKYIHDVRYNSATCIQKFLKGYLIHKEWKQVMHESVINRLSAHFRELKLKLHTDSQIKIRFAWRLHQRRKQLKKAKRLKKEAAAKAKKQGKKIKAGLGSALAEEVARKVEEAAPPRKGSKRSPKGAAAKA